MIDLSRSVEYLYLFSISNIYLLVFFVWLTIGVSLGKIISESAAYSFLLEEMVHSVPSKNHKFFCISKN